MFSPNQRFYKTYFFSFGYLPSSQEVTGSIGEANSVAVVLLICCYSSALLKDTELNIAASTLTDSIHDGFFFFLSTVAYPSVFRSLIHDSKPANGAKKN